MKQQKVQAILMATDKPSYIHLSRDGKYYTTPNLCESVVDTNFDLIIISDEEIKEGELIYDIESEEIKKASKLDCIPRLRGQINKKVLSSTDKSLGLPAPDNNSIQYIIDEFNSGKTEVYGVVDYIRQSSIGYTEDRQRTFYGAEELKINPDNTISIKPAYLNEDLHIKWWNSIDDEHKEIIAAEYFKFPITPPFPKEDLYVCNYRDLSNDVINYIFRNLKVNIDKFILDSENEGNRYEYGYGMDLEYIKKSLNIFDNTISIKRIEEKIYTETQIQKVINELFINSEESESGIFKFNISISKNASEVQDAFDKMFNQPN